MHECMPSNMPMFFSYFFLTWVVTWALIFDTASPAPAKPVPLVLPLGSSKLEVQQEGLNLLRSIEGAIAPVVVIGPYRSGKSFTLNQLLGVPCDGGFGVGHQRDTQTKGIWIWSQPREVSMPDGSHLSMLFVDTEGFESTGKSNSYDDRVFAVSAILSSVLIYNLPETVRESDIAKLSFAVELASGLYDRYSDGHKDGHQSASVSSQDVQSRGASFEPGALLWLIQRDFLQGKTASEMVHQVLQKVPNPQHDPDVDQINMIRSSLSALASNNTGYSLTQPHLERTRLCELADSDLDPKYVRQRDGLRTLVKDLARPKSLSGKPTSGSNLASLVEKLVEALNAQEIPNVASMLQVFNRDLVSKSTRHYRSSLNALSLPIDSDLLGMKEKDIRAEALRFFSTSIVGRSKASNLEEELFDNLEREFKSKSMENQAVSDKICSELEASCEGDLDGLQNMKLPSMHSFNFTFLRCKGHFDQGCVGPAKASFSGRLQKAWQRSQSQFLKDYNDRLYMGLLFISLGLALVFRFFIHIRILEGLGWAAFVFLQLYPHLHLGMSIYETRWWLLTAQLWEAVMFILFGLRGALGFLGLALVLSIITYRAVRRHRPYWLFGSKRKKLHSTRDLEV